jgi:glycosyltransferase involved in cell wall biosynthesis
MSVQLLHKNKIAPNSNKLFNFVIPTYKGGAKLEVIINCLLAQTADDYHITIVSDGEEPETEKQLEKYFNHEQFSYYHTDQRYNDYGHSPRLAGLYTSNCKYSIMTGFDNYYVPIFVERFKAAAMSQPNVDLIFCDFVLDHVRENRKYNKYIDARLEVNYVDFGCVAIDTQLAKSIGIDITQYAADWYMVNQALNKINTNNHNVVKIPQTLYVHN